MKAPPPIGQHQRVARQQAADHPALAVAERRLAVTENISGMVQPAAASISASASRNGRPSRAASRRPIEVLPAPISPTSTMLQPGEGVGQRHRLAEDGVACHDGQG